MKKSINQFSIFSIKLNTLFEMKEKEKPHQKNDW